MTCYFVTTCSLRSRPTSPIWRWRLIQSTHSRLPSHQGDSMEYQYMDQEHHFPMQKQFAFHTSGSFDGSELAADSAWATTSAMSHLYGQQLSATKPMHPSSVPSPDILPRQFDRSYHEHEHDHKHKHERGYEWCISSSWWTATSAMVFVTVLRATQPKCASDSL